MCESATPALKPPTYLYFAQHTYRYRVITARAYRLHNAHTQNYLCLVYYDSEAAAQCSKADCPHHVLMASIRWARVTKHMNVVKIDLSLSAQSDRMIIIYEFQTNFVFKYLHDVSLHIKIIAHEWSKTSITCGTRVSAILGLSFQMLVVCQPGHIIKRWCRTLKKHNCVSHCLYWCLLGYFLCANNGCSAVWVFWA